MLLLIVIILVILIAIVIVFLNYFLIIVITTKTYRALYPCTFLVNKHTYYCYIITNIISLIAIVFVSILIVILIIFLISMEIIFKIYSKKLHSLLITDMKVMDASRSLAVLCNIHLTDPSINEHTHIYTVCANIQMYI